MRMECMLLLEVTDMIQIRRLAELMPLVAYEPLVKREGRSWSRVLVLAAKYPCK